MKSEQDKTLLFLFNYLVAFFIIKIEKQVPLARARKGAAPFSCQILYSIPIVELYKLKYTRSSKN